MLTGDATYTIPSMSSAFLRYGKASHRLRNSSRVMRWPVINSGEEICADVIITFLSSIMAEDEGAVSASFPDGDIRQLTDGPAIHPFSPAIHLDGELVFFVPAGSI